MLIWGEGYLQNNLKVYLIYGQCIVTPHLLKSILSQRWFNGKLQPCVNPYKQTNKQLVRGTFYLMFRLFPDTELFFCFFCLNVYTCTEMLSGNRTLKT